MKHPTANKEHMTTILKNMTVKKDGCATATEFKGFGFFYLLEIIALQLQNLK